MNYSEIQMLNRTLPRLSTPPANIQTTAQHLLPAGITHADWFKFEAAYNNPKFGWAAADTLARSGVDGFPLYPDRTIKWIYRAWIYLRYGHLYPDDPTLEPVKAAILIFSDARANIRHVLEAMLITHEEPPASLAKYLNIQPEIVEAYDALFFNVYDRKQDFLFLRNVVYPNTRMEELLEEYLTRRNLGTQLLRIGYNKKLVNVLFYAGFRTDLAQELTTQAATELFRQAMMLNGYLLADNGFLNFSKQHAGISSARSVLQSSLVGGTDTSGSVTSSFLADAIRNDLNGASARMRVAIDAKAKVDAEMA